MFKDTPLVIVEDQRTLDDVAGRLCRSPVVGVDTESDSFYHYQEKVCLLQFSDFDADYIVDPLAVDDLEPLAPLFADPDIVKVFHGADYDIVCLKRDFGFEMHNVFDTMIAAQLLGLPRLGLADLVGDHFGHTIDKQYQRHNWAERPLLDEHLDYARGDTHWLLALREILTTKLDRRGRLRHLVEECRILEGREWAGRGFDPDGYLRIKGSNVLDDVGKRVLRRLYLYRDGQARDLDRPTFKVLPDHVLVALAEHRPRSMDDLNRLFPKAIPMKRRHARAFLEAVEGGLGDDFDIPKPQREKRSNSRARLAGRLADRALVALKEWRNQLCEDNPSLTPIGVASNNTMKNIAAARPTSLEELAAVDDVREWQVEEFGEQILAVLDEAVPHAEPLGEEPAEDRPERARRRRRRRPRGAGAPV